MKKNKSDTSDCKLVLILKMDHSYCDDNPTINYNSNSSQYNPSNYVNISQVIKRNSSRNSASKNTVIVRLPQLLAIFLILCHVTSLHMVQARSMVSLANKDNNNYADENRASYQHLRHNQIFQKSKSQKSDSPNNDFSRFNPVSERSPFLGQKEVSVGDFNPRSSARQHRDQYVPPRRVDEPKKSGMPVWTTKEQEVIKKRILEGLGMKSVPPKHIVSICVMQWQYYHYIKLLYLIWPETFFLNKVGYVNFCLKPTLISCLAWRIYTITGFSLKIYRLIKHNDNCCQKIFIAITFTYCIIQGLINLCSTKFY